MTWGAQRSFLQKPHNWPVQLCRSPYPLWSVPLRGYFCPTPENVQSAYMRFLLLLEHLAPVPWITVAGRQGIKVHGGLCGAELERPEQIDVLPRDGRNPSEDRHRLLIVGSGFLGIHFRQERHVVVDDRVGNESCAFVPYLLLGFGFDAKFPAVDKRWHWFSL